MSIPSALPAGYSCIISKLDFLEMMHEYPAGNADVQALTLSAHSNPHPFVRSSKYIAAYATSLVAQYEHERTGRSPDIFKRFRIIQSSGQDSAREFLRSRCRLPDVN